MKVLVVGAGVAGLATALGLAQRGIDVRVLERGPRVGGRVRTLQVAGCSIEIGPAGILDDAPETRALLQTLGAHAPRVIAADEAVKRRYVCRGGRARALPTGPLSLLFGSTLTIGERLAIFRELRVPRGSDPDESVAAFTTRRFGASLSKAIAQPAVVGVFGGDYEMLEMRSAFPRIAALEAQYGSVLRGLNADAAARKKAGQARGKLVTFAGGMGALPVAIAKQLGDRVRLGAEVVAIEAGAVRLANGESVTADHIVLTGPPEVTAPLLTGIDARIAELLSQTPSAAIASVSLAWKRTEVAHSLDGFGLIVPRTEGLRTIGVLFMTSIFPSAALVPDGEILLRVMLGGPNDPDIDELDDAAILDCAAREVGGLFGVSATPRVRHLQRWPRAIAQYTIGHAARAAEISERARSLGITVAGTSLHGVGVNDVIRDAAQIVEQL